MRERSIRNATRTAVARRRTRLNVPNESPKAKKRKEKTKQIESVNYYGIILIGKQLLYNRPSKPKEDNWR